MTEVKIFAMYTQFLSEFTANCKDSYSQYSLAYSPMCESSIRHKVVLLLGQRRRPQFKPGRRVFIFIVLIIIIYYDLFCESESI